MDYRGWIIGVVTPSAASPFSSGVDTTFKIKPFPTYSGQRDNPVANVIKYGYASSAKIVRWSLTAHACLRW